MKDKKRKEGITNNIKIMKKGSKKCAECNKVAEYRCSCGALLCNDCSEGGYECIYQDYHFMEEIET